MKKEKNNVNTERTSQINEIQKATIELLKPIFTKYDIRFVTKKVGDKNEF